MPLSLVSLASVAHAQVWNEFGDAGDSLYAPQKPVGAGSLTTIYGTTFGPGPYNGNDADLYCIRLNGGFFSATTDGFAGYYDTMLSLYDRAGNQLLFSDDDNHPPQYSRSSISGNLATGEYLLSISPFAYYSFDANNQLLQTPNYTGGPLDHWGGYWYYLTDRYGPYEGYSSGAYGIALTGASYCVPEPGAYLTAAMLFGGLGIGLVRGRRKKA